jgi:hypothetical protein
MKKRKNMYNEWRIAFRVSPWEKKYSVLIEEGRRQRAGGRRKTAICLLPRPNGARV